MCAGTWLVVSLLLGAVEKMTVVYTASIHTRVFNRRRILFSATPCSVGVSRFPDGWLIVVVVAVVAAVVGVAVVGVVGQLFRENVSQVPTVSDELSLLLVLQLTVRRALPSSFPYLPYSVAFLSPSSSPLLLS